MLSAINCLILPFFQQFFRILSDARHELAVIKVQIIIDDIIECGRAADYSFGAFHFYSSNLGKIDAFAIRFYNILLLFSDIIVRNNN